MFELKKYRRVIFYDAREWCKIWRKSDLWLGLLKMYKVKIYKGVMCYDNEEWYNIWKGIDLSVQNWPE